MSDMQMKNAEAAQPGQEILAVAEAIRELGEVPSGHLYATLMPFMTLNRFNTIIALLKRIDLVSETGNVLKWCKK